MKEVAELVGRLGRRLEQWDKLTLELGNGRDEEPGRGRALRLRTTCSSRVMCAWPGAGSPRRVGRQAARSRRGRPGLLQGEADHGALLLRSAAAAGRRACGGRRVRRRRADGPARRALQLLMTLTVVAGQSRLAAARRVVVKIGSALLVEQATGRVNRAWLETLAWTSRACLQAWPGGAARVVRRDRARPPAARPACRQARAGAKPGGGGRGPDPARACVEGRARAPRHPRSRRCC